jgi:hypothetical protein
MAATPGEVFGTITSNILPSGSVFLAAIVVIFFMFCAGVFIFLAATKHTRPRKYRAVIFERIGKSLLPQFNKVVIYKRKAGEEGYYIDKRKVALSIEDAYLDKKARPVFFLQKVEDTYVALSLSDVMPIVKKSSEGKETVEYIHVSSFIPHTDLNEYRRAITQSAVSDAKKWRWVDKLAPLVLVGVPMISLLLHFFLTAWSVKQDQTNLAELKLGTAQIAAVVPAIGELTKEVAESNQLVAKYLGEVHETVPAVPPG